MSSSLLIHVFVVLELATRSYLGFILSQVISIQLGTNSCSPFVPVLHRAPAPMLASGQHLDLQANLIQSRVFVGWDRRRLICATTKLWRKLTPVLLGSDRAECFKFSIVFVYVRMTSASAIAAGVNLLSSSLSSIIVANIGSTFCAVGQFLLESVRMSLTSMTHSFLSINVQILHSSFRA